MDVDKITKNKYTMAIVEFKKEDFVKGDFDEFHVEYKMSEIGSGSNLLVETLQDGIYDMVQVPIRRSDNSIFICFSEPTDGRLIFEKYDYLDCVFILVII